MRSGSPAHDGRGWSAQRPYQDYGPDVSWPNGFRRVEQGSGENPQFDTGEYQRLVESTYRSGEYGRVDPRRGTRAQQPPAADDYGYGDPGYADPSYDGPPRSPGAPGYQRADVYPVTGAQEALRDYPAYPVTGAQEALPSSIYQGADPRTADYPAAGAVERQRRQDVRPNDGRRADPRLDGLRYDEIRYDERPRYGDPRYQDARADEPGYDEPLTDEAWYAELRRTNGPGYPAQAPARPGGSGSYPAAPPRDAGPRPGPGPMMDAPRNAGPGPAGGSSYPRAAAALPARPSHGPAGPPRGYAQGSPRPEYLGAPIGQVGLLTPPGGTSAFGAPGGRQIGGPVSTDTVAWTMAPDADELDSFEEFWQEDDDEAYTGLLDERPARVAAPRDTGSRPAVAGRRRGRSGDRRLWLSLGAIGVVAAGAIFGILKFEFPGGGPAHILATPAALSSYQWNPSMEKNANFGRLKAEVVKMSGGQASGVVARAYEKPGLGGAAPEMLQVFGAHLPNTSPAASIAAYIQKTPGAQAVTAGPMGGAAACSEQEAGTADSWALCVWFDNDSFGVLSSQTMSAAKLANLMLQDRPLVEKVTK